MLTRRFQLSGDPLFSSTMIDMSKALRIFQCFNCCIDIQVLTTQCVVLWANAWGTTQVLYHIWNVPRCQLEYDSYTRNAILSKSSWKSYERVQLQWTRNHDRLSSHIPRSSEVLSFNLFTNTTTFSHFTQTTGTRFFHKRQAGVI